MQNYQYIEDIFATYLRLQVGSNDLKRVKLALQEICKLYRRGYRLKPNICAEIEIGVVGHLNASTHDSKVRRWCLNVLSVIGTNSRCKSSIEDIITRFQNDPDTISAALTAYFRIENDAYNQLSKKDFIRDELIVLAAIKGGFIKKVDSAKTRINIEAADPPVLRSALLGVGLGLAPEHIFDPSYTNGELVGKLSQHDDELVSQYSVWAVAENPNLNVSHLGVNIKQIDDLPGNVRGWIYRLYAEQSEYSHDRHELIVRGSEDNFHEARRNLAIGLKENFYDGLEAVICPWYYEEDEEIQPLIADHMVRNSQKCIVYEEQVKTIFINAPVGSIERKRMLALSSGTGLFGNFKRIDLQGEGDLFGQNVGGNTVTNNVFNIGNVQGGAVSLGGDSHNTGHANNTFTGDQVQKIGIQLDGIEEYLRSLSQNDADIGSVIDLIAEAKSKPNPETLKSIVSMVKEGTDFSDHVVRLGGNVEKLVSLAAKLLPYIPL